MNAPAKPPLPKIATTWVITLPTIPLTYYTTAGGWSSDKGNAKTFPDSRSAMFAANKMGGVSGLQILRNT